MTEENKNKRWEFIPFTWFLIISGLILIGVGVYFLNENITSSGFKMNKYQITGKGTIAGPNMIFIGGLLLFIGLILSYNKKK